MTPANALEHMFSRPSPLGSPPPAVAWVVFANGTVFYSAPTDVLGETASLDEIEQAARAALAELGPVVAGTPAGDFNVARLDDWFPDDPVYLVSFDDPRIAAIVIEEVESDLAAGLIGRAARDADHADPQIVEIRGFDGSRSPPR